MGKGWKRTKETKKTRNNLNNNEISELPPKSYNDVHLGLIGKRVVDFLLLLIELFFAKCYGCVATGENR